MLGIQSDRNRSTEASSIGAANITLSILAIGTELHTMELITWAPLHM
jgi:hypothetical protein